MGHQSNIVIGTRVRGMQSSRHMAVPLQEDSFISAGALDGSVDAMSRFLKYMAGLVGVPGNDDVPVLTLQFGEILTATSLMVSGDLPCLSITALLPRYELPGHFSAVVPEASELLWDADEGRYVLVRKIPIALLPDERSVLDAILEASDSAKSWFASVKVQQSSSR